MPSRRNGLPRWAAAGDIGAVALLLAAVYVWLDGGFAVQLGGLRLSVRSAWRLLLWASILLCLRHVLIRDAPLHRRLTSGLVRLGRRMPSGGALATDRWHAALERGEARAALLPGWVRATGIVGLFAALTAVMTYPQVRFLSNGVSVNDGDALFSTWRLAWIAHQLPRDPLNLFNANIFYPEQGTLAFSDAIIVPGLIASPLLWLGVPRLAVHNLIFLSGFALSGAGMFLLVRSLTGSRAAALFAGFAFAFLPFRYVHYAHLELQMTPWMPLGLWAFHKTLQSGRPRDGLLTGLFLALQCLSSWYYGIFFATFLVPVAVATLAGHSTTRAMATLRALAAGAVLTSVLVVPMSLPYFAARERVGERPESEIRLYSAVPGDYLLAHRQNVLVGPETWRQGKQERELYMGFVVPLIALVGLWPPLSAARIGYALALLLALDVSFGYNGALYPWLHEWVVPYRGLRVPARMAMLVGLGLAILGGYGCARLLQLFRRHAVRAAVLALLLSGVFVEYRSVPRLRAIATQPPPIYDALPAGQSNVLLELPLLDVDITLEPLYMYFSTFHWNTLVNGYSGFSPPSYVELRDRLARFPDAAALAEIRRRRVTHIVLHGGLYREGEYAALVARIDECRDLERIITVAPPQGKEMRLYRVRPAPAEGH
jgi:hypothetical protein